MASNSSAEEARRAQDVEAPLHHQNESKGTYHWGRGGEGNKMTIGENGDGEKGRRRSSAGKMFEKGKEMLGFKGKGGEKAGAGSAIMDE